jgi:WD40 repeat protein
MRVISCQRLTMTCLFLGAFAFLSTRAGRCQTGEESKKVAAETMLLLHNNCMSCHNQEKHKGGLQLTSREGLLKGGDDGPVVSDKVEQSAILKALAPDADPHMPPKKQLSTNQISLLKKWVAAGTPWDSEALAKASAPRVVKPESLPPGYQPVLALALSADGKQLAIGRANRIYLYDLASTNYAATAEVEAHRDAVRSLAWSPDGKFLASGSFREITLWESKELKKKWTCSSNLEDRITVLRFSPYGGALIAADGAAGFGAWVRILNPETGKVLNEWQAHNDSIYDLAISPDSGVLVTASADKLVKSWELVSQREIAQYEGHSGAVFGLAFNTNATELVTVSTDRQLKVWDVKAHESVVTIGPKKHGFNAVVWSQDGTTVVAGDDDGNLYRFRKFKRHTGQQSSETAEEREIAHWPEPINCVVVNADSSRICAGTQDGTVYIVNADGKILTKLEQPQKENALASSSANTPSFVRDVLPMMAKAGCMAGSCHAKPEGQNGFKLSVFSYDPKSDFSEIVKEAHGRRIFPAAPEESLILLKPTMTVEHGGGQRFEIGSDTYKMLLAWIRGGMVYQHKDEPQLAGIDVDPKESTYGKGAVRRLKVQARYSDGSARDVTPLADYLSNDKEIAKVDEHGSVQIGSMAGESVIVVRYMGFVDASRITVPSDKTLPAEKYASLPVNNFIDRLAYVQFRKLGLYPSELCSDSEFLRRSSLDTIGMLPTADEARAFLADPDPGKRKRWVEHLLNHPSYADYWANKWADLLRPNPDRVGVKSVFLLDEWLRESFRENKPYDQFVREIVTAEGSNHRDGPVVIYRDRREPPELTTMFSQLFLGVRMECAKCHHHPNEKWSQDDFYQLAAYFGPLKQKGAGLSPPISAGTETFYFASGGTVKHPLTDQVMKPKPLDGPPCVLGEKDDPRIQLAEWMTNPANPYFAKAAVNRVWATFLGRGFVEPVDDFRISNPASNEPLLNALAEDFASRGYDLKQLIRTILNSRLYQLSSAPNEYNLADTKNYSRSLRRRLPAEVLLDAMDDVTEVRDTFNGCPPGTRAMATWSYKVESHFMDAFGRPNPSSDCPCERDLRTSVVQSLHMMNSNELQRKLASKDGRVKKLADSKLSENDIVNELYLTCFNRFPTSDEIRVATDAFKAEKASRQTATEDVLWALLNSPEFVFNH